MRTQVAQRRVKSKKFFRSPLFWLTCILLAAGIAGYARYRATSRTTAPSYRTVQAVKRSITGKITASGTLSALVTVQVGTQVSGRIQKLFVDFNSHVKKGDIVARIDPQIYQASAAQADANYLSAEAGVAKAKSELRIAELQSARAKSLYEANLVSKADYENASASAESAKAVLDSAKASLAQAHASRNLAHVNLSFTNIISPIDGVVISRNVDVGQTVAASLQAPTLFTIAQDLTKMQVDTNVAEADIGRLAVAMPTSFTVDAFPGKRFRGKIREIRNAPIVVQNVVTYDAVIDVENADLSLRPGMTANVTVVYAERSSVVAVPNSALRYKPASAAQPGGQAGGQSREGRKGPRSQEERSQEERRAQESTLWILRGTEAQPVVVHLGLSDGMMTEIVEGDVHEGDDIVAEALDSRESGGSPSATPSQTRRLF